MNVSPFVTPGCNAVYNEGGIACLSDGTVILQMKSRQSLRMVVRPELGSGRVVTLASIEFWNSHDSSDWLRMSTIKVYHLILFLRGIKCGNLNSEWYRECLAEAVDILSEFIQASAYLTKLQEYVAEVASFLISPR